MNSIRAVSDEKNSNACHFIDPVQGDKLLGAFRAACGIRGALVLVHAPVGCHWGVNYLERLSAVRTSGTVSALRERSVVFGGEESLRKTVEIILKDRKQRYLILLAGSVPSIIGEDWQGVIDAVGFDFHSIALDCGGYLGTMGQGYDACLSELCEWMDDPPVRRVSGPQVNLLGVQRDIARGAADIKEIRRVLALIGIRVNSVLPPASVTELKKAPDADLNIVFGYGMELAQRMEQRWGVPAMVFTEYPYGLAGTENFVRAVGERLGTDSHFMENRIQKERQRTLDILKTAHLYLPALHGLPAAVSGDLPLARGLARFLAVELGVDIRGMHITSSPDGVQEEIRFEPICSNILFNASWERFKGLVREMDVALILGSDLDRSICTKENRHLIPISYPTITRITLTPQPYMGFRGVLTLAEEIINLILKRV